MSRTKQRKTKIVATIGPASDRPEVLRDMIEAGLNVARLNFSHGTAEEHKERLKRVRGVAEEMGANIAIMLDTRGIEIRIGRFENGEVELKSDAPFTLFNQKRIGTVEGISVTYENLYREVTPGDPILLDDGAIELSLDSIKDKNLLCTVVRGGILRDQKGLNLPETELSIGAVSLEQHEDIYFAAENEVDYIAASFVQNTDDIAQIRALLAEKGASIPIIAKIENKAGVSNLDSIVQSADGIMVARGDLGVELSVAEVPVVQKKIIRTTVTNGKPVITATQMLDSMERNLRPTRAEVSDVANAILDGSSAVMLSGETAIGKYPVEAIKTMSSLALRAEASLDEYGYLQKILPNPSNLVIEAVGQAATNMVNHLNAAAVISLTESGLTSRLIAKYRPKCPNIALTGSRLVMQKLALNWGVVPILYEGSDTDEAKVEYAIEKAREMGYVMSGDIVVATGGHTQTVGGTDRIRVARVP